MTTIINTLSTVICDAERIFAQQAVYQQLTRHFNPDNPNNQHRDKYPSKR